MNLVWAELVNITSLRIVARLTFLLLVAISRGGVVAVEQPRGSLMPRCPLFVRVAFKLRKYFGIQWTHVNLPGAWTQRSEWNVGGRALRAKLDGVLRSRHAKAINPVWDGVCALDLFLSHILIKRISYLRY